MNELLQWLDDNHIVHKQLDGEVVELPGLGKLFLADLSGVGSIFRNRGGLMEFNLMENPQTLLDEGIEYVAFPFGDNFYYYDLREEFRMNILRHVGKCRATVRAEEFVNLGVHTPYELLNAAGDIDLWVRKAAWMGHTALGICDRNTMAATLNLQKACDAAGLHPVMGYSFEMTYGDEHPDMKVYALTQSGLANLLHIQREIMVDAEEHTLRYDLLLTHGDGNALVFGAKSAEWMLRHPQEVTALQAAFDMTFYQVDLTEYKAERIDRERLLAAQVFFRNFHDPDTGSFSVEPILITDSYYPDQDDAPCRVVLNKIATGAAHEQSSDQYLKDVDEHYAALRPLFGEEWNFEALFSRMCRNTVRIAQAAQVRFATGQMYMPQYMMREDEAARYADRRMMLHKLLDEGMEQKVPATEHARYRERLEEELYVIESTDNVDYFLIQWDMVCEAHRRGIATGIGRGSAGGALVAYLLGITSIDPIRYGLLFSRFLVPERCGLQWCDQTTIIRSQVPLRATERYVEIETERGRLRLHPDARLRVVDKGGPRTIYADELSCGDEILFDRRDFLWTIDELTLKDNCLWPTPRKDG